VIALDTNVLVYAHRTDSEFHPQAAAAVRQLAESPAQWAVPWPCLHEFYSIVTHPRIYNPPSSPAAAADQIAAWLESPSVVPLSEGETYWAALSSLLSHGKVSGPLVHDARIAALCLSHGIRELWSADRDFSRFPRLKVTNPLVGVR
jgi:toxin-antitoxin system PIN domain toxin